MSINHKKTFRAWDTDRNDWIPLDENVQYYIEPNEGLLYDVKWGEYIQTAIVEQYSSRRDKHKVRICEGDIVKHVRQICYYGKSDDGGDDVDITLTRVGVAHISGSSGLFFKGVKFEVNTENVDEEDLPTPKEIKWTGKLTCLEQYAEIIGHVHSDEPKLLLTL